MHDFRYTQPTTSDDALRALGTPGALPLGGGTDLLVTIKEQLVRPEELVDLRFLPGAREITTVADGSVRIGAAVRIADLASHPMIIAQYAVLAEAARQVGTPALRNMGTIGGNLGQRPRCWYFRRAVPCLKNGGTGCAAIEGENQYHGIVDEGTCRAVHPSDPAVALAALDALVEITGAATRTVTIDDLFHGAANNPAAEMTLQAGEMISAVILPAKSAGGTQRYVKLMQRGAWDFALVSLAAVQRTDGNVRMVLGGVAAAPWRVNPSIEEDVGSGGLDAESIDALTERALYDVAPLSNNAYKVTQAAALLKDAMRDLSHA